MKTQENTLTETLMIETDILNMYEAIRKDKLGDKGQWSINCVKVDLDHAVVTNGHFLIYKKLKHSQTLSRLIHTIKKIKSDIFTWTNKSWNTYTNNLGEILVSIDNIQYPDYKEVIAPIGKETFKLTLDTEYLKRIADQLSTDRVVTIEIPVDYKKDPRQKLRVVGNKSEDDFAILMPVVRYYK